MVLDFLADENRLGCFPRRRTRGERAGALNDGGGRGGVFRYEDRPERALRVFAGREVSLGQMSVCGPSPSYARELAPRPRVIGDGVR